MKIKSIASSSAGNCTVIESAGQQLIIDCGIPVKRIRQEIKTFENVVGCFVTHAHGDHARYTGQLVNETNIKVYNTFKHRQTISVNGFIVWPIRLFHDVECFGFLIMTRSSKLFYATDTNEIPYTFPNLTHAAIETNFDWNLIANSNEPDYITQRTIENHLSIDSAIEFIDRHPVLEEIHLLHLSDRNSNAEEFQERIESMFGVPVFIAPK